MLKVKKLFKVVESDVEESDNEESSKKTIPVPSSFRAKQGSSKVDVDSFFVFDTAGEDRPEEKDEVEKPIVTIEQPRDKKLEKLLSKAVCHPGLEKNPCEKPSGRRAIKRQNKIELEKTAGKKWFDMPATELTEEARMDLELLQMRRALDPLAFYRKNDTDKLPKYFQVGRVVDAPEDYYSGRMTKAERKNNMVDELLADMDFQQKKRKAFNDIKAREAKKVRGTSGKKNFNRKKKDSSKKK